jgi:hypothetical protein
MKSKKEKKTFKETQKTQKTQIVVKTNKIKIYSEKQFDLYSQLNSINVNTRISTLKEILALLNNNMIHELPKLITTLCKLLLHENLPLRKQVLEVFDLLLDKYDLSNFIQIIVLFIRNSFTFITDSVKNTGLQLFEILLLKKPDLLKSLKYLLVDLFGLLGCKLTRLKALEMFYLFSILIQKNEERAVELVFPFNSTITLEFPWKYSTMKSNFVFLNYSNTLSKNVAVDKPFDFSSFSGEKTKKMDTEFDFTTLLPVLINLWIESSIIFSNSSLDMTVELKNCHLIIKLISLVFSFDLKPNDSVISLISTHILRIFPFAEKQNIKDTQAIKLVGEMNIEFSTVLLLLAPIQFSETIVDDNVKFKDSMVDSYSKVENFLLNLLDSNTFTLQNEIENPSFSKLCKLSAKLSGARIIMVFFY